MLTHILLSLTLLLNLAVTSQKPAGSNSSSKPDFTGTWNALILKSDREPIYALKISYREPKLEIVSTRTSRQTQILLGQLMNTKFTDRFVYYTDGRGETQTGPTLSGESSKSRTERIGDKFVITSRTSKDNGKVLTTTMEVSSDGKTLTETTSLGTEGNTRRRVELYDRISGNNTRDINGEWVQRLSNRLISVTVEHREPEIKVTRRELTETQDESEVSVYYTDGRGETNIQRDLPVKSVTKWKNDTLVFELSTKSKRGWNTFVFKETKKWQIDKDGKLVEVSQETASSTGGVFIPPGPRTIVFKRGPNPFPD